MSGRLAGKNALVTAAGQGIGRASALAMAREGATVLATDIDAAALQALAGVPGIRTQVLDVLDDDAIARTVAGLPPLDVLFNCAGYVHSGTILDATDRDWDTSFAINARAMFVTIRCALPGMLEKGRGSIVNMASMASSIKGFPNRFVYSASKGAVIGLTKAMAADYVTRGIRCNAIAPGTIETPSLHQRVNTAADPVAALKNFVARQPMGRLGQPEEIAPMVVYLASDESSLVTGCIYSVDGGVSI